MATDKNWPFQNPFHIFYYIYFEKSNQKWAFFIFKVKNQLNLFKKISPKNIKLGGRTTFISSIFWLLHFLQQFIFYNWAQFLSELLWTNSICFEFDFKFEHESLNLNISNNLNLHLENLHFENSGKYLVLPQKEIMIFNLGRKSQQLILICQELVLIHFIVMNQKWLKNQVWKLVVTLKNQKSLLFNPLPGNENSLLWAVHAIHFSRNSESEFTNSEWFFEISIVSLNLTQYQYES